MNAVDTAVPNQTREVLVVLLPSQSLPPFRFAFS